MLLLYGLKSHFMINIANVALLFGITMQFLLFVVYLLSSSISHSTRVDRNGFLIAKK